jgi:hypothetical protein
MTDFALAVSEFAEDSECSPGIGAVGGRGRSPGYRRLSLPGRNV